MISSSTGSALRGKWSPWGALPFLGCLIPPRCPPLEAVYSRMTLGGSCMKLLSTSVLRPPRLETLSNASLWLFLSFWSRPGVLCASLKIRPWFVGGESPWWHSSLAICGVTDSPRAAGSSVQDRTTVWSTGMGLPQVHVVRARVRSRSPTVRLLVPGSLGFGLREVVLELLH